MAFRAPDHCVAWVKQKAIVKTACARMEDPTASEITASEIMRQILEAQVIEDQSRKPLHLFANESGDEVARCIESAKSAIDKAFGMIRAGRELQQSRRTA